MNFADYFRKSQAMAEDDAMSPFPSLPEGCVANIVSFTSPKDACRAAVVSSGFQSAADSDIVWDCFLPSEYQQNISDSGAPIPVCSTKKQLYFLLCDSGLLLDRGKLSLRLSKGSGKKCYMVCARQLHMTWVSSTPMYWAWTSMSESRFSEVAQLLNVCWLDICATLPSELLSPDTNYASYLVFKLSDNHSGLDCPLKASVKCIGENAADGEGNNDVRTVRIVSPMGYGRSGLVQPAINVNAKSRVDGWMEVELGEFFVGRGDRFDVVSRLFETEQLEWKRGLIVEGIEVRPKDDDFY